MTSMKEINGTTYRITSTNKFRCDIINGKYSSQLTTQQLFDHTDFQ